MTTKTANKLMDLALLYAGWNWHIFPLKPGDKTPLTEGGFKAAVADPGKIRRWWRQWPDANIGLACGASGLVVLDFDTAKEDYAGGQLLDTLRTEQPTTTAQTGSGGFHLLYQQPEGDALTNRTGTLPRGVDVRGVGGYIVVAPSVHPNGNRYAWIRGLDPKTLMPKPLPDFVREMLAKKTAPRPKPKPTGQTPYTFTDDLTRAAENLKRLNPARADNYSEWIDVGMALSQLGDAGLQLWDEWSAQSSKYQPGVCAQKWPTFQPDNKTLGSLVYWANEDDPRPKRNGRYNGFGPAPDGKSLTPNVSLADVLEQIATIGADDSGDKLGAVRELVAPAVESLPRTSHREIVSALVNANIYTKTDASAFVRDCVADAKQRAKDRQAAHRQAATTAHRQAMTGPEINTTDRQLDDLEQEATAAIVNANAENPAHPVLYVRGGVLTRVVADENGNYSTVAVGDRACKGLLAQIAEWVAVTVDANGNEKIRNVFPPADVAGAVVSRGEWPELPGLDGIVNAPVFSPDGALHDETGYNPDTRLYYTGGLTLGDTSPENLPWAKSLLLDDLFVDFPFRDDASRAHALALFLLPYVRPMILGPTPLHLIDAPTPGTGKGLLADVCGIVATGRELPSTTAGNDDEEWRKRITSALLAGGNFVSIDNITKPLDSGVLASALTQSYWSDRVLGASLTVNLKVRAIWVANGNNVVPSDEIARRALWIRIDADREKPWERSGFKHPKLKRWASDNRADLIAAALTLVRAWVAEGMPDYTGKGKGSYDEWANVLGGILETAGIPGFLANENELFETTVNENSVLSEFVTAWKTAYGENVVTVTGDLFPLASFPDDAGAERLGNYKNLLQELLGSGKETSRKVRLGKLLERNRDKVIAGAKIVKERRSRGGTQYRLVDIAGAKSAALGL